MLGAKNLFINAFAMFALAVSVIPVHIIKAMRLADLRFLEYIAFVGSIPWQVIAWVAFLAVRKGIREGEATGVWKSYEGEPLSADVVASIKRDRPWLFRAAVLGSATSVIAVLILLLSYGGVER